MFLDIGLPIFVVIAILDKFVAHLEEVSELLAARCACIVLVIVYAVAIFCVHCSSWLGERIASLLRAYIAQRKVSCVHILELFGCLLFLLGWSIASFQERRHIVVLVAFSKWVSSLRRRLSELNLSSRGSKGLLLRHASLKATHLWLSSSHTIKATKALISTHIWLLLHCVETTKSLIEISHIILLGLLLLLKLLLHVHFMLFILNILFHYLL